MRKVHARSLLILLLSPSIAFPCKRPNGYKSPTMAENFASASFVFEGEAISNEPSTKPGNHGIFWSTKGTFRIVRLWKGNLMEGKNIEIHLQQSTCDSLGQSVQPGSHWVIFARPYMESGNKTDTPVGWSSGFEDSSFELTAFRYPKTKDRDVANIQALEKIARAQIETER